MTDYAWIREKSQEARCYCGFVGSNIWHSSLLLLTILQLLTSRLAALTSHHGGSWRTQRWQELIRRHYISGALLELSCRMTIITRACRLLVRGGDDARQTTKRRRMHDGADGC
jgi:hypothetical protein